jgi:phosphoribosylformylglycinamidine cyclo-ligase
LGKGSLTYQDAGVSIDRGNALVDHIKPFAAATQRPEVIGSLGGFAGIFDLAKSGYEDPLLLACTDGVGTKLLLAGMMDRYDTVGVDLVAMCVNDLVVSGAEPLLFLDYLATGALQVERAAEVIKGIADGCRQAGAALLGGETAEMPGLYRPGEFDLAGFCVGAVERDKLIDGAAIGVGDAIIGLGSSGPHSNGYSLIRKIIEDSASDLSMDFNGRTLGEVLLQPTRIYVRTILDLLAAGRTVHGMAHVTGGGLLDNVPRILPDNTTARIDTASWTRPEIFDWLQELGKVTEKEMLRTFNCGIGMVLMVPAGESAATVEQLNQHGAFAHVIGEVAARRREQPAILID